MFYIPGNHDPIEMFEADESKRMNVSSADPGRNVHGRTVQLREGLVLLGLGGSVQNYKQ
jgi:hypothetical protein